MQKLSMSNVNIVENSVDDFTTWSPHYRQTARPIRAKAEISKIEV